MIFKSPKSVPFDANMIYFGAKSDIPEYNRNVKHYIIMCRYQAIKLFWWNENKLSDVEATQFTKFLSKKLSQSRLWWYSDFE